VLLVSGMSPPPRPPGPSVTLPVGVSVTKANLDDVVTFAGT
jgi:hypothetical protein